jgi:hypothetical protein
MRTRSLGLSLLITAMAGLAPAAWAATALVDFEFNEGSGNKVTDSIASLVGAPGDAANPPTFETASPSGQPGDTAVHFESGQYYQVNDPSTQLKLNPDNPDFTLQAWVKFDGNPSGRMVFFYSNGPGGAVSFSVNTDRTVFVTTLGILDQRSNAAIPDDGQWHHIAVIHQNGVQFTFYVDGVLLDTQPYTGGVLINRSNAQTLFSIGAEWNGALQYVGSVDRLKITAGMVPADQLDFRPVPPAGAAGLSFANPMASPLGFSLAVNEVGGTVADTNSIVLALNGATISPSSVIRSSPTSIVIGYTVPGTPLPSGSTNTINLVIKDTKGLSYTNNATFVVTTYGTLPANALVNADTTKKGFKVRTYQIDGPSTEGTVSSIAYNEDLLAGKLGPNVANTTDPVAGDADSNGFFIWTSYINFDDDLFAVEGYFNDPDYPKSLFPGIPGNTFIGGPNENFALEILTALQFPAPGMYSMAVNTDWTGFPDILDGFQVRSGANPTDAASSVVLGFFDAAAPAGPTRGIANSPFQFYVPRAGSYLFRLLYYQTSGGAQLEWYMLNADGTRTLINDSSKPNTIPAYYQWTAAPAAPTLSIARSAGAVTITFTGTLEAADAVTGPWAAVPGTSPMTIQTVGNMKLYRAKQ